MDFLGSRRMETAPTQSQSDEPSDLLIIGESMLKSYGRDCVSGGHRLCGVMTTYGYHFLTLYPIIQLEFPPT